MPLKKLLLWLPRRPGISRACRLRPRDQEAAVLAVCLDPTPSSISKALELGAECILSHHPLLLKPVLPARLDAYHEVLRLLLTADVPLYAAHHLFRR